MIKKTLIISLSAGLIVLILVGVSISYLFKLQAEKDTNNQNPFDQEFSSQQSTQALSSNTIISVVAFGKVSNIDGLNVTLTNRGDSITILFPDSAEITYSNIASDQSVKLINFNEIKIGDELNVNLKISQDGAIQATSAFDSGPELTPGE